MAAANGFLRTVRLATTFSLGIVTFYACGGSAVRYDDGSSGGSSSSGGSIGRGGSTGKGGTGGLGGVGTFGGTTGTDGGTTGSGGIGTGGIGPIASHCFLPKDPGPCKASVPAYFHDANTGVCEFFVYGGCQGNPNRFQTLEECQKSCHGGSPNMDACVDTGQCMIATVSCCGACGSEGRESLVAINRESSSAYEAAHGCTGIACGPCPPIDELSRQTQYFTTQCQNSECLLVDIRDTSLTNCGADEQCRLRQGAGCCEGCGSEGWIAVNIRADFTPYCGMQFGCPDCAPSEPQNLAAVCDNGKCKVVTRTRNGP